MVFGLFFFIYTYFLIKKKDFYLILDVVWKEESNTNRSMAEISIKLIGTIKEEEED